MSFPALAADSALEHRLRRRRLRGAGAVPQAALLWVAVLGSYEIPLLLGCDVLLAQEHHLVTQHRVIQLLKLVVAQRAGDVDTGYLRANIRPQRGNA